MLNHNLNLKNNLKWSEYGVTNLTWLLLIGVALLAGANLLFYLVVPVDGAAIWVRQGPVRVINTAWEDQTGLQVGDIILQVQGHNVTWWLDQKWRTWPEIINRWRRPNPTVEITLQRDQQVQSLAVPLFRQPGGKIYSQFLTHMLVGFTYLAVSGLILKVRSWDPTARLAAFIMVLLALIEQNNIFVLLGAEWGFSTLWLFIPMRLLTRWFTYSAALHFCLIYPTTRAWLRRIPQLPLVIYLLNPIVTLTIMLTATGDLQARHGAAYPWSKNIYLVYLALACILLIQAYLTHKDPLTKTQLSWVAWGATIAILPNIFFSDLPILVVGHSLLPPEVSGLFLVVLPISVAVAILRYRLWDIDLVIRASLIYGALTITLGAFYLILIAAFIGFVGASGANPIVYFLAALVVVFLFEPARRYFQRFIDRFFYRHKLDYNRILADLSRQLSTSLVLDDLFKLLNETIPARLNLQRAQIYLTTLPDPDTEEYRHLQQGNLISLYQLDGEPFPHPASLDGLQQQGLWACVPLLSGNKLLGLYGLGRKKSGKFYNAREITLIETLARQAGVALQNAQLHAELADQARLERDLEIARQIQLSLLPGCDPKISDLDIVGFSLPAQSVGGDFYHYFEFSSELTGIAVGDVSGKGVPAALLMAVSISTLRAQAHRRFRNTAQLLTEMNDLLQVQMRISDVNVAMLYATIEKETNGALKFNVSNGGLISPILLRPGQPCEYLDACGLPMGIIEDPRYYECCFNLWAGDLIILCSDGIVEAMNENREMFGFERLEQVINETPFYLSAADFITHLRQVVDAFVGNAPQHDDMTVVAIRVGYGG